MKNSVMALWDTDINSGQPDPPATPAPLPGRPMATTFSGPLRKTNLQRPDGFPNCTPDELAFEMGYLPVVTDQVNILIQGDIKACTFKVEGPVASLLGPAGHITIFRSGLDRDEWARYLHARWAAFCADTVLALMSPAQASA